MSDYFGALIRSAGMRFGGRPPAIALVEPGAAEIDDEREPATMPSRTAPPAPAPPQPVALLPAPSVSPRITPATDGHARDGHATFPGMERADAHPAADADRPAARATDTGRALGQALVRAAVEWVAADPQNAGSVARAASAREISSPHGDGPGVFAATHPLGAPGIAAQTEGLGVTTTLSAADRAVPEPGVALTRPVRSSRPEPAPAAVPVAPAARDELVEISIGAIHVRVEAPAPLSIARPAATPPAASVSRPRSALARRALRRI